MHSSVNRDRSKREVVSVVQMQKEGKGLAEEFRVLLHRLHCLYDGLGNAYKGGGKYGIDVQNDQGTRLHPEDQLHPIPHW